MYVGIGILDLHLPWATDLKARRRVVRGLVDRLHARHRISIAETGDPGLPQRAQLGVAVVSGREEEVERMLQAVLDAADQVAEATVLDWSTRILEEEPS